MRPWRLHYSTTALPSTVSPSPLAPYPPGPTTLKSTYLTYSIPLFSVAALLTAQTILFTYLATNALPDVRVYIAYVPMARAYNICCCLKQVQFADRRWWQVRVDTPG